MFIILQPQASSLRHLRPWQLYLQSHNILFLPLHPGTLVTARPRVPGGQQTAVWVLLGSAGQVSVQKFFLILLQSEENHLQSARGELIVSVRISIAVTFKPQGLGGACQKGKKEKKCVLDSSVDSSLQPFCLAAFLPLQLSVFCSFLPYLSLLRFFSVTLFGFASIFFSLHPLAPLSLFLCIPLPLSPTLIDLRWDGWMVVISLLLPSLRAGLFSSTI